MDSSRAKNIILLLLFCFNVFLLARIVANANTQEVSRETILNTQQILESRGIGLECEIPRYKKDTPRLVFGNGIYYRAGIIRLFLGDSFKTVRQSEEGGAYQNDGGTKKLVFENSNSFTYTDEAPGDAVDIKKPYSVQKYVEEYLKDKGIVNSAYVLDKQYADGEGNLVYTYTQKYKKLFVFNNYATVKVTAGGVTYLKSEYREVKNQSAKAVSDLASAYKILLKNFSGGEKVTITDIDLGYKIPGGLELGAIQSEQLPVWRIRIKGSDRPRYFEASEGKEIK